jgi:hypothetical protein
MKKISTLVLAALLLCPAAGCALFKSPDAAFVAGMDAGLSPGQNNGDLLNKYDKYVDADLAAGKITADTAKIEHRTAALLRGLLEDAKKK